MVSNAGLKTVSSSDPITPLSPVWGLIPKIAMRGLRILKSLIKEL